MNFMHSMVFNKGLVFAKINSLIKVTASFRIIWSDVQTCHHSGSVNPEKKIFSQSKSSEPHKHSKLVYGKGGL